ncbi:MAG: site-specific integrase [Lacipirellulaceae bacterium]
MLPHLDTKQAEELGLIQRRKRKDGNVKLLTLSEGRTAYEQHLARPRVAGGVKKSTRKRYRTVFDKFVEFAEANQIATWNRVTEKELYGYAAHLESKGYASKSIRNELVTLSGCVRWLIEDGQLAGVEPIKLKLRKVESQHGYCYTVDEVSAMIERCSKSEELHWLRDIIVTLACTGFRISELGSLRWSDIDFEKGQLKLHDESGHAAGERDERRQTKSGRSRSLPLYPELSKVLKTKKRKGRNIFNGPRGGAFKPDTARRIFVRDVIEPLSEKFPSHDGELSFKDGRFHSFRHYFCSKCANSGVPERIVMQWLGHADSEMIKHYYHLHDEEAKRQMNHLDFLGRNNGRSVDEAGDNNDEEDAGPSGPEART